MNQQDFQYKRFFDISPDLLCIAGFDGYFKKVNPAVAKVLGYSMEELYARPIDDFVYEEDKERTGQARQSLTGAKALYHFENRYVTKEGDIVWLAWTSYPIPEEGLVFAIAKEITHKKEIELERKAILEDLTQSNDDLKQFSLSSSHDLRSPLNNLLSIFELLDVSNVGDRETLELLQVLKLTGQNLKESLDNYVDVLSEKLNEKRDREEVRLSEVLNEVVGAIDSLVQTSGATIHADFSRLDTLIFNKFYLRSVFLNLISNAIKYAHPDRPPVITIRSDEEGGVKSLTISDNGLGFDLQKVKGKLFQKNQTFHNHHDSKGIGLYLVHRHITSMGGEIGVESTVNEGTRFIISFS